jgi:hypothetical protein
MTFWVTIVCANRPQTLRRLRIQNRSNQYDAMVLEDVQDFGVRALAVIPAPREAAESSPSDVDTPVRECVESECAERRCAL